MLRGHQRYLGAMRLSYVGNLRKSVYDAKTPADAFGTVYRGTLFYVLQDADDSMSAEEFEETSSLAGMGRYRERHLRHDVCDRCPV